MSKTSIFFNIFTLFIQLYIAKVPIEAGSGENFPDPTPDPTKKVRIRNPVLQFKSLGRSRLQMTQQRPVPAPAPVPQP